MKTIRLNGTAVERLIPKKTVGAYCLGYYTRGGFVPKYVGMSEACLRRSLKMHADIKKYSHFRFWARSSIYGAFFKACEMFHSDGFLQDGLAHPIPPKNPPYSCHICTMLNEDFIKSEVTAK